MWANQWSRPSLWLTETLWPHTNPFSALTIIKSFSFTWICKWSKNRNREGWQYLHTNLHTIHTIQYANHSMSKNIISKCGCMFFLWMPFEPILPTIPLRYRRGRACNSSPFFVVIVNKFIYKSTFTYNVNFITLCTVILAYSKYAIFPITTDVNSCSMHE